MGSLRVRLLRWLIGPVLIVNLAGGALVYVLAWVLARLAFDQGLLDMAGALAARVTGSGGALQVDLPPQAEQILRRDETDAVYLAVRDSTGRLLAGDPDFPRVAAAPGMAFDATVRGEPVRMVFVAAAQGATVGVAKTLRKRGQTQAAIVRALILLETLVTLVSVGLIWYSVSRGLRPLGRLRAALRARAADDLAPTDSADVPVELEPVVRAMNALLEQAAQGTRARQDFLANMAHQLRTPLAGLHAQLDVLDGRQTDAGSARALAMMRASTERMIRQVNQLLALARAEPAGPERRRMEPVALDALLGETVQHFVEQAARKAIDLGFELAPALVQGDRFLLRDLADNLIDNAIRYTPPGGRVTVACAADAAGAVLTVEDNGPGIPPALRAAVFSRFVRLDQHSAGTGLGLAIVRDIAAAHGAGVTVETAAGGQGACFIIRFSHPQPVPELS
ncbi:sensor histidine kinase [Pseudoduganella plicata]|uniref:histidine kinase n=1 Tax=Pseudoduganella plicata TaxID=321984 RepID=A0A4P7BAL1_9BURK|nr:sensor histidine kinase [Pseudoduganella plicata]QBQ35616.1 sensor histidine kinase [Pseudoduganella plicata]GGY96557.1 two-component system sensor kinase [Pseudoduganella plicata]